MRVDSLGKEGGRDPLAEFPGADPAGEHELDLASADLLVELHRGEELLPLRGVQFQAGGQAGAPEDSLDAVHLARGQAEDFCGEPGGGDLPDGNRFAMQIFAVVRDGFEGVADGVAEVQDGPQAALRLVLPDHFRLDLAAAGDNRCQDARVAAEQFGQITLQLSNSAAS